MTNNVLTDEQKDRFVSDICEYGTGFVAPLYSVVEAIEQAVLQSPEIQRLRKDAERYRWLRDDNAYFPEEHYIRGGQELDEEIDYQMEKQL